MLVRGGGDMDILKNIACAVCVVVFVIGICAVVNRLLLLFVRPRCGERAFTVLFLDDEVKDPAAVISYYVSVYSVSGGIGEMKIICVDRGLSEKLLEFLRTVFAHEKHVVFMTDGDFFDMITQKK